MGQVYKTFRKVAKAYKIPRTVRDLANPSFVWRLRAFASLAIGELCLNRSSATSPTISRVLTKLALDLCGCYFREGGREGDLEFRRRLTWLLLRRSRERISWWLRSWSTNITVVSRPRSRWRLEIVAVEIAAAEITKRQDRKERFKYQVSRF
ncbi:hypothetical protein TIFTF001_033942 [Ficus carica]|uniref:Uncharacterized protein n=1 Tax=Ficus carica TaxID=3494 RepID=A0AA88J7U4_FICCA|nr:hypothetical protein TIFTF001_033942 [Ficus carica]